MSGWGLSLYIVADNITILFDFGPSPEALLHNAKMLNLDLCHVDFYVLSHEHFDHLGGIVAIARQCRIGTVYVPAHVSTNVVKYLLKLGLNVVKVEKLHVLSPGVYIVEFRQPLAEQVLAINVCGRGLVVFTGCAHPGILNIVEKLKETIKKPIYGIIGGLHLIGKPEAEVRKIVQELVKENVSIIVPPHCSGKTIHEILSTNYPDHYIRLKLCHNFTIQGS